MNFSHQPGSTFDDKMEVNFLQDQGMLKYLIIIKDSFVLH